MLTLVYGTRGELIKFASLIKELEKRKIDFVTVDTFQQDTKDLSEKLKLPQPNFRLKKSPREAWSKLSAKSLIKVGPYGIGAYALAGAWSLKVLKQLKTVFEKTKGPIVYLGNTMTVSLAARAAKSVKPKPFVIDYEGGLRTGKDATLDYLYKVGENAADLIFVRSPEITQNLDGIKGEVVVIGNPATDLVKMALSLKPSFTVKEKKYVLANSVRIKKRKDLINLVEALENSPFPSIFIVNPMVKHMLNKMDINLVNTKVIEPVDYVSYIHLLKNSVCAITDSNGVEEECAVLGKPCIVINNFLQYKELSEYNIFVTGCNKQEIISKIWTVKDGLKRKFLKASNATKKAVDVIENYLN